MTKLEQLAAEVALVTPLNHQPWAVQAYVPWTIIDEIRFELTRTGVDWRAARKRMKGIERERAVAKFKPEVRT
jgi:hypothetical protein